MDPMNDEDYNKEEETKDNTHASEKNDHHYKDVKQCKSLKLIAVCIPS